MACDRKIGNFDCCSVVQGDCLDTLGRPKRVNTVPLKDELTCRGCGATWKHDGRTVHTRCPFCGTGKDARAARPSMRTPERLAKLKAWRSNPANAADKGRRDRATLKKRVFFLVARSPEFKCVRCKCDDWRLLEINHKNGGGKREHESGKHAMAFYWDIVKGRRTTDDLELLCRPCNALHYLEMKFGPLPLRVVWEGSNGMR